MPKNTTFSTLYDRTWTALHFALHLTNPGDQDTAQVVIDMFLDRPVGDSRRAIEAALAGRRFDDIRGDRVALFALLDRICAELVPAPRPRLAVLSGGAA